MYPPVPLLLVTWLASRFPGALVSPELPPDLEDHLPVVQVSRFGGVGSVISIDSANCDVDVWHTGRGPAELFAGQIRAALESEIAGVLITEPVTGVSGVVSSMSTLSGPSQRPVASRGARSALTAVGVTPFRVGASYRVVVKSH